MAPRIDWVSRRHERGRSLRAGPNGASPLTGVTLAYALAAGAANVLGALAVTSKARWSVRALETLLALAAGFMIAVALIDLMPEAIAQHGTRAGMVALAGFLLVHLTQHTFASHFHFGEETHQVTAAVGATALIGLLLHTFVDGVAIASAFAAGPRLGTLVWTAVVLHKLPEGLAISSLFLAAGFGRRRAVLAAAALGLATVAGAASTGAIAGLSKYGLALSAGVTLYVAASNLIPEFQSKSGWRLPSSFFLGAGAYVAVRAALNAT